MFTILFLLLTLNSGFSSGNSDVHCEGILEEIEAPVEIKTRGKPRRARWEQLDRTLHTLAERAQEGSYCHLTFDQVFVSERDENVFIPITHVLLKYVPEAVLKGLKVYSRDGEQLGIFESRFPYERTGGTFSGRNYVLYYFQYRTQQGEIQSVPRQPLLDNFLVTWADIKNQAILAPREGSAISEDGRK